MANNPIVEIGSQYCAPNEVDLVISREGEFVVYDMNGNFVFNVRGQEALNLRNKRVIFDAAGNPMVNFKQKQLSEHWRWNVFRGENTDDKDFLFTIKTTSIFQRKTNREMAVFLANNKSKEKDCDYMIKGSWSNKSRVIDAGDYSTIVAQISYHSSYFYF